MENNIVEEIPIDFVAIHQEGESCIAVEIPACFTEINQEGLAYACFFIHLLVVAEEMAFMLGFVETDESV